HLSGTPPRPGRKSRRRAGRIHSGAERGRCFCRDQGSGRTGVEAAVRAAGGGGGGSGRARAGTRPARTHAHGGSVAMRAMRAHAPAARPVNPGCSPAVSTPAQGKSERARLLMLQPLAVLLVSGWFGASGLGGAAFAAPSTHRSETVDAQRSFSPFGSAPPSFSSRASSPLASLASLAWGAAGAEISPAAAKSGSTDA